MEHALIENLVCPICGKYHGKVAKADTKITVVPPFVGFGSVHEYPLHICMNCGGVFLARKDLEHFRYCAGESTQEE